MTISQVHENDSLILFKVAGQRHDWAGSGRIRMPDGVGFYDWEFPDTSLGFGKTLIVITADGSLYGHVVPFKINQLPEVWYRARKSGGMC